MGKLHKDIAVFMVQCAEDGDKSEQQTIKVSQSASQSVGQSDSHQSISQPVSQSDYQPVINESISQPVSQSVSQSVIKQPASQSVSQ